MNIIIYEIIFSMVHKNFYDDEDDIYTFVGCPNMEEVHFGVLFNPNCLEYYRLLSQSAPTLGDMGKTL